MEIQQTNNSKNKCINLNQNYHVEQKQISNSKTEDICDF